MALRSKTPEEKAAKEAAKTAKREADAEKRKEEAARKAWQEFWTTPAGQARRAYADGDVVFEYSVNTLEQKQAARFSVIGGVKRQTNDATIVLNAVSREGWELLTGSHAFIPEGSESRDKFLTQGEHVVNHGYVQGYYLFKRCEANQSGVTDAALWEQIRASFAGQS